MTLTRERLSLAIRRETVDVKPVGFIGIDRNLDNVTLAASNGSFTRHDLTEATRIKATYRHVR